MGVMRILDVRAPLVKAVIAPGWFVSPELLQRVRFLNEN
jgi:hypothetical protein